MKRKMWVVSLALLLVLSLTIAGCGGSEKAATEQQEEPEIMTIIVTDVPVMDWDPAIAGSPEPTTFFNTYETLLLYLPDTNTFKPVLAESYSKSEDGLVWNFKLRQGVKFHDGTDFNADAVKFSIDRTKNMKKSYSYIWDPVQEIKVIDDYTVQFILSKPAPLDMLVSAGYNAWIYSPTAVGTDYQKGTDWFNQGNDAGTGPYMVQSQVSGNQVILTKFDGYWGGWEGKHFDKVMIKSVVENATRRQMIEGGEADFVFTLMPEDMKALKDNPNIQIIPGKSYINVLCFLNTQKAPLNNKLVRQALAYSYPYQQMVDYVKLGYGAVAKDTVLPAALYGSTDKIPYTYDLEKAKALLEEAGFPNGGLTVDISVNSGEEDRKKAMEMWKSELAKIGVDLVINSMPWDSIYAKATSTNPEDRQNIATVQWWPTVVSPNDWYASLRSGESWNFCYTNDKEMDEAINAANDMLGIDRNKATEMYKAIGQKFADECLLINLWDEQMQGITNKSLKGYKPNPAYPICAFVYDLYREK